MKFDVIDLNTGKQISFEKWLKSKGDRAILAKDINGTQIQLTKYKKDKR